MTSLRALGWGVLVVVLLVAGAIARRFGGGDGEAPPPSASGSATVDAGEVPPTPTSKRARGRSDTDGYEVAIRLVALADKARFDTPSTAEASAILRAQWRKLTPPFVPTTGAAQKWIASVALRTSAQELQWATAVGKEGKWAPEARIWNMNEGSFDQREAIVQPASGKVSFHVDVPSGAKLTFAEGTLNAIDHAAIFRIEVVDASGRRREIHRRRIGPVEARRWTEDFVDLSAFAGQSVDLELSTEAASLTADEALAAPARAGTGGGDAGEDFGGPGNAPEMLDGGVVEDGVLSLATAPVAVWGNPTILTKVRPRVPHNVLWIVVDALRPDVVPSFHDDDEDRALEAAPLPPLEARLPKVPGLTPAIDALVARGARFTHAYSAACWTRPGTLAMLAGARSSEVGIETTSWIIPPDAVRRFYASDPPLLPLLLRRQGVATRAFVNNYFMIGYAPVGIDMGFERIADHRYRTRDTLAITEDATRFLRDNKDTRFFLFVNYNSPHEPYEPPARHLARVPPPPIGPVDPTARLYMAEGAKDDEAIGRLMQTVDELGLRDDTLVVVTADHGETMSSAHVGTSALDKMPIRYHHAISNFEETARVPIVIAGPGVPPGAVVNARVRSTDIAPTILDLLGLELPTRMSGRSLTGLMRGIKEPDERVIVTEGRMSRAIMHGKHRLVVREGLARTTTVGEKTTTAETLLFDLERDPGERADLSATQPEIVEEMKARLTAALGNVAVAGSAPLEAQRLPTLHLRFAGGRTPRRVHGTITIGDATSKPKTVSVEPVEAGREIFKSDGARIDVALTTSPATAVGLDLVVDPPGVPVRWQLWLDDGAWPDGAVYGGPFGIVAPSLREGVVNEDAKLAAQASILPIIDPKRDVGLFVARERRGEPDGRGETEGEGAAELARLLREWGYANGSGAGK